MENIEQEGEGRELLIASGREGEEKPQGERERVYSLERFDYVKESDSWRCLGGGFWHVKGNRWSGAGHCYGAMYARTARAAL